MHPIVTPECARWRDGGYAEYSPLVSGRGLDFGLLALLSGANVAARTLCSFHVPRSAPRRDVDCVSCNMLSRAHGSSACCRRTWRSGVWVRMGACGNACPCACLRCSLSFFAGHGSDHARYPPTRFHCDYSHPSRSLSSRREILRNEKQTAGLRSSSPDVSMTRPGARRGTTGRSPRRGLGRWARTRTCQRADGSWVGTQAGMACALRRRRGHRRSNGSAEPNGPASM